MSPLTRDGILEAAEGITNQSLYLALHTASPPTSGNELSGNAYDRVLVASGAWTNTGGIRENSGVLTFPVPTGDWSDPTHWGLWTTSGGGELLVYSEISPDVGAPTQGATVAFGAGTLRMGEYSGAGDNRAPVWSLIPLQTVNVNESIQIQLSSYVLDPDFDDLSFQVSETDADVSVGISGSVLTINGISVGTAEITVLADDGQVSASRVFNVTVASDVLDPTLAPTWSPIPNRTVVVGQNIQVELAQYVNDLDSTSLTFSASESDADISIAVDGSILTVTGVSEGVGVVDVTANDGTTVASTTFAVTVTATNAAPIWSMIPTQNVVVSGSVVVNLAAYVTDTDDLTFGASENDANVSISLNGAHLTISGISAGSAAVNVTANDGTDTAGTAFSVTVSALDDQNVSPVWSPIPTLTIPIDSFRTIDFSDFVTDPDDAYHTFSASENSPNISLDPINGSQLTIGGDAVGQATVTATADDGQASAQTSFNVIVADNPPIWLPIPTQAVHAGGLDRINLNDYVTEPEHQAIQFTASNNGNANVIISLNVHLLDFTVLVAGSFSVSLTVSDGTNPPVTTSFTINASNFGPVWTPIPNQGYNAPGLYTLNLEPHVSDPDGDAITITATVNNNNVTVEMISPTVAEITTILEGSSIITFSADDGRGGVTPTTVNVTVGPALDNSPPVWSTIPHHELEVGDTVDIELSNYVTQFGEVQVLAYSASEASDHVSITLNGSLLTITAISEGGAVVTATVNDGTFIRHRTISVGVRQNDPPVWTNIPNRTLAGNSSFPYNIEPFVSDPDNDSLVFTATTSDADICDVGTSNTAIIDLYTGGEGTATVTVTADDGRGGTAVAMFDITVDADPFEGIPQWSAIPDQILTPGTTVDIDLSAYCYDPNNDPLTYVLYTTGDVGGDQLQSLTGSILTIGLAGTLAGPPLFVSVGATDGDTTVTTSINWQYV